MNGIKKTTNENITIEKILYSFFCPSPLIDSFIVEKTKATDVDRKRKSTTINKTSNEVISIPNPLTLGVGRLYADPVRRARHTAMVARGCRAIHEA
ncbi:MAG: hypothetical protein VX007_09260 [Pseudomonadota bacterium]|nr:hypothetical protein [Pseudomonadota bacterium]